MKKLAVLLAIAALSLAGCNTVAGVGEDITGGARLVGACRGKPGPGRQNRRSTRQQHRD